MESKAIQKSGSFRIDWSKLGLSLSLICAIHCLAMPFVITLLPLAGTAFHLNFAAEIILIGSSIILSGSILVRDYRKHHRNSGALVVLAAAVFVIGVLHLITLADSYKWVESSGGILLFAAFLVNRRHMKAHHKCAVHPHGH